MSADDYFKDRYQRTNSDRIQDAIFILVALLVTFLIIGIPILNTAGVSLEDVINWIKK